VSEAGELGAGASEATARMARYNFLERVRHNDQAIAIITAHHQDDLLETAILNLLRGTGRKGLSSLVSRPGLLRPLLQTSKEEISSYAQEHHVVWHEDSTNTNDQYTRNYIRHQLLPRFDAYSRRRLLDILASSRTVNAELDNQLGKILQMQPDRDVLDRQFFVSLPHAVAKELLATWLRVHDLSQFDAITLERVTIAAKIQHSGAIIDVVQGAVIRISETKLALRHHER
jgi:tRNA(Ile)-lysidine synthase TilS/MesJ